MIKLKAIGTKLLCATGYHLGEPLALREPIQVTREGWFNSIADIERHPFGNIVTLGRQHFVEYRVCPRCHREVRP